MTLHKIFGDDIVTDDEFVFYVYEAQGIGIANASSLRALGLDDDEEEPMRAQNIDNMFGHLTFKKPAAEIVTAAKAKVIQIKTKIEERQTRIANLREEYAIDDAALVQLLQAARKNAQAMSYAYTSNSMTGGQKGVEEKMVGAGVVNNLLTENDFIEAEKDQVARLELIARNLKPMPRYASGNGAEIPPEDCTLSYEELKYLGF